MAALDEKEAKKKARAIFRNVKAKLKPLHKAHLHILKGGKLYEFYCLARTLEELEINHGVTFKLSGDHVAFKSAPGGIYPSDPHFEVWDFAETNHLFNIYVDIEFKTLGHHCIGSPSIGSGATSYLHELDIVVVEPGILGYPQHDDILLGVECKSNANFGKWIVKQVLGVRREMAYLQGPYPTAICQKTGTNPPDLIPANPPSEFWLAYIDPKGDDYKDSPAHFGIEFKHWQP